MSNEHKDMSGEECVLWTFGTLAIVGLCVYIMYCIHDYKRTIVYCEHGYSQEQMIGKDGVIWKAPYQSTKK